MTRFHGPIVVGVDGSDQSRLAVRYGVLEAERNGSTLRLVHVVPDTFPLYPMLPVVGTDTIDDVSRRIVDEARHLVSELSGERLEVEARVESGFRVPVLVDAAEDARLIVLGHRDRSLLGRVLTSSTSTGVAARAHCPVICVPATWRPGDVHRRVAVGVEGPEHSQDALAVAFAAAAERNARLAAVHAWKLPGPYDDIIVSRVEIDTWRKSAAAMLESVLQDWRERFPGVDVELDIRHQYTAPALLRAAEKADLLVLGRRGRGAPLGLHLGSVARTLIRESPCPVEVAPPRSANRAVSDEPVTTADEVSPQT